MKRGDHACLIYDNYKDQLEAVLPFVKAGLERNESCLYISNDLSLSDISSIFDANGINVQREIDNGALIFSSNSSDGRFVPQKLVESLRSMAMEAESRGFQGFRATGEMTWVLGSDCGCDKLIEYEVMLNEYFPSNITGICQYNSKRFNPATIRDILRTHPVVIVKDKVCRNLYCENQRILQDEGERDCGIHWMMENLIRFHTMEESLRNTISARDDFLSIASHELNTPLSTLLMRSQLYSRKDSDSVEWKRLNESNLRTIHQLIGIVDGMLDVTRMSKGVLRLSLEKKVDLEQLVRSVVSQVSGHAEIQVSSEKPVVGEWDPYRLRQVISNLLSNAIKYGEGNSIEVVVSDDGDNTCLTVEDHGLGIAPKDQRRIFQLYERAVPFTNISGLGIGLYISDQIVNAHGGNISVQSELGHGATFRVTLPKTPQANVPVSHGHVH